MKRYYSLTTAAQGLGVPEGSFWQWVKRGLLPRPLILLPGRVKPLYDEAGFKVVQRKYEELAAARVIEKKVRTNP